MSDFENKLRELAPQLHAANTAAAKADKAWKDTVKTWESRQDIAALKNERSEANKRKKELELNARDLLTKQADSNDGAGVDSLYYSVKPSGFELVNEAGLVMWLIDNMPKLAQQVLSVNMDSLREVLPQITDGEDQLHPIYEDMPLVRKPTYKTTIHWSKLGTEDKTHDQVRTQVIQDAQSILAKDIVVIDTETSSLLPSRQVVEIGIISGDGEVLLSSLVKPTIQIDPGAFAVHEISNEDVESAPTFADLAERINAAIAGKVLVGYNTQFDVMAIKNSAEAYGVDLNLPDDRRDVMELSAQWVGERNNFGYRSQKLTKMAEVLGIDIDLEAAHSASADAVTTLRVLQALAEQDSSAD